MALCIGVRLRAAVFVNAVAIREAVSLKHGIILPEVCVSKLQSANYLFHSALNSTLPDRCDTFFFNVQNMWQYATCVYCASVGFWYVNVRSCCRSSDPKPVALEAASEATQVTWCIKWCPSVCQLYVCRCALFNQLRLDHLVLDQAIKLSPMHTSCYSDEDLVPCICKLCVHHVFPVQAAHVFLVVEVSGCLNNGTQVGKVKQFALMATSRKLGRQVLQRRAAYVCVRWLRRMDN